MNEIATSSQKLLLAMTSKSDNDYITIEYGG